MLRVLGILALVSLALTGCSTTESVDPPQDAMSTDTGTRDADAAVERKEAATDVSLGTDTQMGSDDAEPDVGEIDTGFDPDASYPHFCDLPGSVRYTDNGVVTVPPATAASVDLRGFLKLPKGFCVHAFGNVAALAKSRTAGGNVRQLRFSPSGDLFVASPTAGTTGGGQGGLAAIVVLPDDNHDGLADTAIRFAELLPQTQGLLFANDHFYYQDGARILRVPYQPGDRKPSGPSELVVSTSVYYTSMLHWPRTLDQADDGTIYVTNGSDQDEGTYNTALGAYCMKPRTFVGGILELDGSPNGKPVSRGFRNPIAVRCQRGHNVCFASELAKDYSAGEGGREKLVPIREGDDWGFPCCATTNVPYTEADPAPDCSYVTPDDVSFLIGDTPFGLDFERGGWPTPYKGSVFVALHGDAGFWGGARVVAVATDPTTGSPKAGTTADGGVSSGSMTDFATGWDDAMHTKLHGRPAAIEFAADGRMFVGNDNNGDVFWVAPLDLPR
jgi:glucose/arabinose dehydrogenase